MTEERDPRTILLQLCNSLRFAENGGDVKDTIEAALRCAGFNTEELYDELGNEIRGDWFMDHGLTTSLHGRTLERDDDEADQ